MIKPEAVAAGHAGKIIEMIIGAGYKIIALKYTRLSSNDRKHRRCGAVKRL